MPIGLDEFTSGDPEALYARMRPDQRTAIANEFVRVLILAGDPHADDFHYAAADRFSASLKDYAPPEESSHLEPIVPHLLSPEEAARVHTYTREHHPDLFEAVAHHPVTLAALAYAGVQPKLDQSDRPAPAKAPRNVAGVVRPYIAGSAPHALTPEGTGESIASPGIEVGAIEKRDNNVINDAIGDDTNFPPV